MQFTNIINTVNEWIGKAAALLFLPIIVILFYEVTARYLFDAPTEWAHETSAFIFGAAFVLGGAYVLRHRGHVNVDIFYGRFDARGRAILDLLTSPLFFIFIGTLLWQGGVSAWDSVRLWEHSNTVFGPLVWPIKLIIPVGALLMLVQGVVKYVQDLITATKGRESA